MVEANFEVSLTGDEVTGFLHIIWSENTLLWYWWFLFKPAAPEIKLGLSFSKKILEHPVQSLAFSQKFMNRIKTPIPNTRGSISWNKTQLLLFSLQRPFLSEHTKWYHMAFLAATSCKHPDEFCVAGAPWRYIKKQFEGFPQKHCS